MSDVSRILVVEDEGLVALELQDRLIKAGYDVPDVATSSEEALNLTKSLDPDLVLMDIRLRGPRDGIDTAQDIRARTPIPIIFVTANADAATLQRARASRPAGFFVKPIPYASLMSSMEMAIHRSRTDQYSAFLAARKRASDDLIFITDVDGNVEFVSPALGRLAESDLLDHPLSSLISQDGLHHDDLAREVTSRLAGQDRVQISRGLFLTLPGGKLKIPVTGEATLLRSGHDSMRIVWELRDLTGNEWHKQQIRRDQNMLVRGQFASGISETAYRLFEMIPALQQPNAQARAAAVELACQAGMEISRQLTTVCKEKDRTAELVDINSWITKNAALISTLVGRQITVCFDLSTEPALVRLPAHSIGQILMGTFESLRRRLAGPGSIQMRIQIVRSLREVVRLEFLLQRSGTAAWTPFVFPFESEESHFEISIANAIVTAAGGSLRYAESWANAAQLEIIFPRSSDPPPQVSAQEEDVVLLVGTSTDTTTALERQFEADGKRIIRSENESEALIVAQLYKSDIATVVADTDSISTHGRERVERAFLDRNPNTKFIWRTFGCRPSDVSKDSP